MDRVRALGTRSLQRVAHALLRGAGAQHVGEAASCLHTSCRFIVFTQRPCSVHLFACGRAHVTFDVSTLHLLRCHSVQGDLTLDSVIVCTDGSLRLVDFVECSLLREEVGVVCVLELSLSLDVSFEHTCDCVSPLTTHTHTHTYTHTLSLFSLITLAH
jgi:hypothetical protein